MPLIVVFVGAVQHENSTIPIQEQGRSPQAGCIASQSVAPPAQPPMSQALFKPLILMFPASAHHIHHVHHDRSRSRPADNRGKLNGLAQNYLLS